MDHQPGKPTVTLEERIQSGINKYKRKEIPGAFLRSIAEYLADPATFIRMEVATDLGRPAVEPLVGPLKERFRVTRDPGFDSTRQFIGLIVRWVMEQHGYEIDKVGCKVSSKQDLFNRATRYRPSGSGPQG